MTASTSASAGTAASASIGAPVVAGARWDPPAAIAVRGTVLLLPGRGEHAGVYDRFGRRLAADGYAVRSATPETVTAVAADAVAPLVLAGSDTGALYALALAATVPAAGVIAAGVPWAQPAQDPAAQDPAAQDPAAQDPAVLDQGVPDRGVLEREVLDRGFLDWGDELEARSACPTHRARLEADGGFQRGTLAEPVPQALVEAVDPAAIALPVLLVHGGADLVAPLSGARELAARLARAELATVRDGRHDALNDSTHRTVAAHVVQWLERLRADPATVAAILTVS
ncbi:alpha/beta hydrolase [Dactylosporangium sp. NPDC051484]|uniref:serine aminopeptidase domain-containing protein n=1 Tax=Dactylosporangium sp. NPDC051484 TaxID=3154942 RepID=UPI00344B72EA